MSDQPKKQELPPLDTSKWVCTSFLFRAEDSLRQRNAQLLAALSDNEAKDARIAEIPLLDQLLDKRATEIESLRAKLKSVEGMAKEKLRKWNPYEDLVQMVYAAADVDALLARIREAIQ